MFVVLWKLSNLRLPTWAIKGESENGGVGGIAETDITLSMTCNAMILVLMLSRFPAKHR